MRVVLTDLAKRQIADTARYIRQEFGKKSKESFLQKVREIRLLLNGNPYLGPVEPLLAERVQSYRSVVVGKLNKMVYYIDKDTVIYIVAFWDCRQEPTALASQVK